MNRTPNLQIGSKDAIIIADMQNDFLPGGTLGIKDADQIIPILNDYARVFKAVNATVIASRDWHPPNHISFKEQGGPWSPHCVQNTEGAQFSKELKLPEGTLIVSKATDPVKEAYSVFDGTGLSDQLKQQGITRVFIGGLATDYCVVNTVIDARKLGLEAVVLVDATCGIDVKSGDVDRAFETMAANGATEATLEDFPEPTQPLRSENVHEVATDEPLVESAVKKKARMRARGNYKRVRRERG